MPAVPGVSSASRARSAVNRYISGLPGVGIGHFVNPNSSVTRDPSDRDGVTFPVKGRGQFDYVGCRGLAGAGAVALDACQRYLKVGKYGKALSLCLSSHKPCILR